MKLDYHTKNKLIKFSLLSLIVLNLFIIISLWWANSGYYVRNPSNGNGLIALGRIFGLLGAYTLIIQIMLVSRTKWIEGVFGFDKLNKLHRLIGYSILILLLNHPLFLIIGYANTNQVSYVTQLSEFLTNWNGVLYAFFGLITFILIISISIAIVRKRLRYETWYFVHLLTYLSLALVFKHQVQTADVSFGVGLYYWYFLNIFAIGNLLLYRFLRPLYLFKKHHFVVDKVVEETPDTWSLYVTGKNLDKFYFNAGQYANINILAKKMWYTHPFSFSSAYNGKFIRFTIKGLGDYTNKISGVAKGTRIVIDGPLGLFIRERAQKNKFLFIAGGIGITPIRAMIELISTTQSNDMILLFGSRTEKDIAFKKEFDKILEHCQTFKITYILSTQIAGYESGYIDKEKIIRLVPDFLEREVFLCGPPVMMQKTALNLKEMGFDTKYLHFEKFSF